MSSLNSPEQHPKFTWQRDDYKVIPTGRKERRKEDGRRRQRKKGGRGIDLPSDTKLFSDRRLLRTCGLSAVMRGTEFVRWATAVLGGQSVPPAVRLEKLLLTLKFGVLMDERRTLRPCCQSGPSNGMRRYRQSLVHRAGM